VEVTLRAGEADASPVVEELAVQPVAGPPALNASITADRKLQIISSTALDEWVLEYTTNLLPPAQWLPAPEQPVLVNGQVVIAIERTGSLRFFRLRHK
jgi:hypothetical protein